MTCLKDAQDYQYFKDLQSKFWAESKVCGPVFFMTEAIISKAMYHAQLGNVNECAKAMLEATQTMQDQLIDEGYNLETFQKEVINNDC